MGGSAIRPFTIEIPEADLDDLRARIAATRWPEKETVDDLSQGVPLATIQRVARYWHDVYDWRTRPSNQRPALRAGDGFLGQPTVRGLRGNEVRVSPS